MKAIAFLPSQLDAHNSPMCNQVEAGYPAGSLLLDLYYFEVRVALLVHFWEMALEEAVTSLYNRLECYSVDYRFHQDMGDKRAVHHDRVGAYQVLKLDLVDCKHSGCRSSLAAVAEK